ncbi:hypothetical protein BDW60DRAFT_191610 [Aspergillus nidulans var. acristatus]
MVRGVSSLSNAVVAATVAQNWFPFSTKCSSLTFSISPCTSWINSQTDFSRYKCRESLAEKLKTTWRTAASVGVAPPRAI